MIFVFGRSTKFSDLSWTEFLGLEFDCCSVLKSHLSSVDFDLLSFASFPSEIKPLSSCWSGTPSSFLNDERSRERNGANFFGKNAKNWFSCSIFSLSFGFYFIHFLCLKYNMTIWTNFMLKKMYSAITPITMRVITVFCKDGLKGIDLSLISFALKTNVRTSNTVKSDWPTVGRNISRLFKCFCLKYLRVWKNT